VLPLLNTANIVHHIRPDMIHVGDLYPQAVTAMVLKRLFGVPYAVYCHGEEITQADRHQSERRMRDAVYHNSDLVIAASSFARTNLLRIGIPEDKIHKVTPGVDCRRFSPGERSAGLSRRFSLQGKQVLLTVARMVPRKGHARVIAAIAELAKRNPNLSYIIVGRGPEESALRHFAKDRGVDHMVHFAGVVSDDQLPEYYRQCDVMVMPNSEDDGDVEGFGMVFLEANAVGKPVIGGLSGGASEAVLHGETGYLVQPDDTRELATTLERLLTDHELRRRLGEYGMQRARRHFEWDTRARRIEHLSKKTLQPHVGSPDSTPSSRA
jgi:phosphatidylinositol alpha-1,6-mannosyltransferase